MEKEIADFMNRKSMLWQKSAKLSPNSRIDMGGIAQYVQQQFAAADKHGIADRALIQFCLQQIAPLFLTSGPAELEPPVCCKGCPQSAHHLDGNVPKMTLTSTIA